MTKLTPEFDAEEMYRGGYDHSAFCPRCKAQVYQDYEVCGTCGGSKPWLFAHELAAEGYMNVTTKAGKLCGVMPMAFTWGLFVGLDRWGYECRYCYHTLGEAVGALNDWNGIGDPADYIKKKGLGIPEEE